jgi:signal transduction histidine kinase
VRIQQQLSVAFLVMALALCALGATWTQHVRSLQTQFNRFANWTTPLLVALGQLKATSLDMVVNNSGTAAIGHQEWRSLFAGVARDAGQDKLLAVVEEHDGAFLREWRAFTDGTGSRESVEESQRRLQRVLDKAISIQVDRLKSERTVMARSVVTARRVSLAASAGAVLLAVALGVFIAGTIARPVIRLALDASIVGHGKLSHRTAVRAGSEIGELASSFNRMTERLEQTTVSKDKLMKAYEELQRAQQQLIQSEKLAALGRFSAGVAHEVKNPLAIILSGIDCIRTETPAGPGLTESLDIIERSVHRADTIVRDLLKFARPSELQAEPVDPAELVDGTVALLQHSGSLKGVALARDYRHDGARVRADKNQIQQVLLNLMMNAVEAMPGGGSLRLATAAGDEAGRPVCRISVTDTGSGIAPEHLPRLFEPFHTTKRDRKGTGLGLSISKTIVESHGGTLTVASEVGKGTSMTVTIPVHHGGAAA